MNTSKNTAKKALLVLLSFLFLSLLAIPLPARAVAKTDNSTRKHVVTSSTLPEKIISKLKFSEGPTVDKKGVLYFSDVQNNCICKWTEKDGVSVFRKDSGKANGLFFDKSGNLVICEGGNGRVTSLSPEGELTVLADKYDGKKFNAPNDLWIAPNGGIYFTDPLYGKGDLSQDGEHVYYITPDRKKVIRVIDNLKRPNGLVGTHDGKKLYVADEARDKVYVYKVHDDGTLHARKLFAKESSDGMTVDKKGNIYITAKYLMVFDKDGEYLEQVKLPERPTNVCFSNDGKTLYITDRKTVYAQQMGSRGWGRPKRQE